MEPDLDLPALLTGGTPVALTQVHLMGETGRDKSDVHPCPFFTGEFLFVISCLTSCFTLGYH